MPLSDRNFRALVQLRDWLTGSWGGLLAILLTASTSIFGVGYWVGNHVAKSESEITIINLNLTHQKELFDEREKSKVQGAQEFKEKTEDFERVVRRVKEEMNVGKK